jgi:hypothetical protein
MQETKPYPMADHIRVYQDGRIESCLKLGRASGKCDIWRPVTINLSGRDGYPTVHIKMNGKHKEVCVHLVVIRSWVGEAPEEGMVCRHLDDNRKNFNLENLEWGTHGQNVEDAKRNRRFKRGEIHPNSKLTDDQRAHIAIAARTGLSLSFIAEEYGISYPAAHYIAFGRKGRDGYQADPYDFCNME